MGYRTLKLTNNELLQILWDRYSQTETVAELFEDLNQHRDEVIKFKQYFLTEEDKKAVQKLPF